jgi:hypothetical protein
MIDLSHTFHEAGALEASPQVKVRIDCWRSRLTSGRWYVLNYCTLFPNADNRDIVIMNKGGAAAGLLLPLLLLLLLLQSLLLRPLLQTPRVLLWLQLAGVERRQAQQSMARCRLRLCEASGLLMWCLHAAGDDCF